MKSLIQKSLLTLTLSVTGVFLACAQSPLQEQQLLNLMHSISSHELYHWVDTLASPVFEGRLTGHKGYDSAAAYISGLFGAWGIKPVGDDGTTED